MGRGRSRREFELLMRQDAGTKAKKVPGIHKNDNDNTGRGVGREEFNRLIRSTKARAGEPVKTRARDKRQHTAYEEAYFKARQRENTTSEELGQKIGKLKAEREKNNLTGSIFDKIGNFKDNYETSKRLEREIEDTEKEYKSKRGQEYAQKYTEAQKQKDTEISRKKEYAKNLRYKIKDIASEVEKNNIFDGSPEGRLKSAKLDEKRKALEQQVRDIESEVGSPYMTDDEAQTYNYLKKTEGIEAAESFQEYIRETLNQREGNKIANEYIKDGAAGKAMYTAIAGTNQFASGIKQAFTEEELPTSKYQYGSQKVRESIDTINIAGYDVGQGAYDLGTTIFNMAPSIAASAVTGGIGGAGLGALVGTGSMSVAAKGNAYKQAIQEGYDKNQAQAYSIMIGALEGGLQYALGGIGKLGGKVSGSLLQQATKNIQSAAGRAAIELGGNMLSEGGEEYLQEILEPVVRNVAFDENNEFKPFTADALYSGIMGALSAGMLEGPGTIANTAAQNRTGKAIQGIDGSQSLIDTALSMDQDTEAYKMADQIRQGKIKETPVNIGQLYSSTEDAIASVRYNTQDERQETTQNPGEAQNLESPPIADQVPVGNEQIAQNEQKNFVENAIEKNVPTSTQIQNAPETQHTLETPAAEARTSIDRAAEIAAREATPRENSPQTGEVYNLSPEGQKGVNEAITSQETTPAKYTRSDKAYINNQETVVRGIEKSENNTLAVIETNNGIEKVPADQVTLEDEGMQTVYQQAATLGQSGAKNIVANYVSGADAGIYLKGYNAYYNAALVDLPFEKVHSVAASLMPETTLRQAYFAGQNDRKTSLNATTKKTPASKTGGLVKSESSAKLSEEMQQVLNLYGKVSGANIIVEDSIENGKVNGYYDGEGNIHLAADAENALNVVTNHELTHYIQQNSDLYSDYRDFVMQHYKEQYNTTTDDLIEKRIAEYESEGITLTKEQAMDELVANATELFMTDEAAIEKLCKENRTLAEKILDFVRSLITKIKTMMRDVQPKSPEAIMLNENLEVAQHAEKLWMEALADAAGKEGKRNNYKQYQINPEFNKEYDAWDGKSRNESFEVGRTSKILKNLGVPDKKIFWDSSKLIKIKREHPEMTDDVIKQVPYILESPVIVMRSKTKSERITMFGEIYDDHDVPVLAILELNPTNKDGVALDEIKIASAYGKDTSPQKLIATSETLYIDPDKNRTKNWMKHTRLQLPVVNIQSGSKNSINHDEQNFNRKLYSLKEDSLAMEGYIRENKNQQEMIALLEKRLKEYRNIEPDHKAIEITAKDILKKYESSYSKPQFMDTLTKLWDYIANSPYVSGDEVMQITSGLAKEILTKSGKMNTALSEQYSDLRKNIRTTKIKVSEQAKSEVEYTEGYNNFRKRNMGSLKLSTTEGIDIDTYYQELAGLYPELFNETEISNTGDQLLQISDVMQQTKPFYENPYGMNMEEAQMDLSYELYDTYFNIKPIKTSVERERNRLNKLQAEYRTKKQNIRKEYQKKYEAQLKQMQEKYQGNQGKVAKALAQQRAAYTEARKAREEGKRSTKLRQSIKKTGMELSKWLISPTDKAHVPEPLRKSILEFVTQIDFTNARAKIDSRTNLDLEQVMKNLKDELSQIKTAQESDKFSGSWIDIDNDAISTLEDLIRKNKGIKNLSEMNTNDLKQLNDALTGVKRGVTQINKLIANHRFESVAKCAESTMETLKKKSDLKSLGKVKKMLNVDMLDSWSFFEQFGEAGMSIRKEIRKGENKMIWDIHQAQEYTKKLYQSLKISQKQLSKWTGNHAEGQKFRFGEREFEMTKAQIMSLYVSMLRPQARHHIETGGIRIREVKMQETGGKKIFGMSRVVKSSKVIRLRGEQIAQITDTLTTQEKEFAKGLQKFLANECAKWGNETSMKLYGYEKFKDPNYFPIKTDENQVITNDKTVEQTSLYAIRNRGMTKSLVKGANNAIFIDDIFDVYTRHAKEMAEYHGYAAPLSDAMKWYNYASRNQDSSIHETVKGEIERVYGKESKEYFVKLIQDINGKRKTEKDVLGEKIMGNYKAAAVAANIRVVLQQPTAIGRAWAVMDAKYLAQGAVTPGGVREAKQNSAIALWKSWGYYETMLGKSMKEVITGQSALPDKVKNVAMLPAGWADDVTWGALWNACKAEIKDKRKDLKVGSSEFVEAVSDRFDDVIDQTQVVDTTLNKTQYMRNSGAMAKMQTAFMAEPSKSFNMLRRAITSGSKKKIARSAAAYAITAAMTSAAAAVMDAFRDDDEYVEWGEKWKTAAQNNLKDNINPLNLFPFIKDVYPYVVLSGLRTAETAARQFGDQELASSLSEYADEYESNIFTAGRMDTAVFEQIQKFWRAMKSDKKNDWDKTIAAMSLISMATGIPLKNFSRDAEAILGTILDKRLGTSNNKNSDRIKMLYDALNGGSKEDREKLKQDIIENGGDEEYIVSSTSKIYTSNIKDYIDSGDIAAANEEIKGLYEFKKNSGQEEKKIKTSIKSSLSGRYKEQVMSGNTEIKRRLEKIKVNGEYLYDDEDFERWEDSREK